MSNNNKIRFILNTSADYFALCGDKNAIDDLAIKEFLDSDELTVLAAINHGDRLIFNHTISVDENCIVFYKIPQMNASIRQRLGSSDDDTGAIDDAIHFPFGILTLEGGLAKSIYNSMARIFSPSVTQGAQYPADLEKLIVNLHSSLGVSLGLPQSNIHSIQHEILFWDEKSRTAATKSDKEAANAFGMAVEKLNRLLRNVATINSLEEFLDTIHTHLDELWRLPYNYPQTRMVDLMDIISLDVIAFCSDQLLDVDDVWGMKSLQVYQTLNDCIDVIDAWIQVCDSLTRLFWPNYARHTWIGEAHISKMATAYLHRLNEIQAIRNVYKEIVCLFNEINQIDKSVRRIFTPFRDVVITDISMIGEKKWRRAFTKYEQILEPIYERIALILKSKLYNQFDNPKEIIQIFIKYETILKGVDVMEMLSAERQQFLQSLHGFINELKASLSEPKKYALDSEISELCFETRELKMFQDELNSIDKVLFVVKDMDGFDTIKRLLDDLRTETEKWIKTNFDQWRDQSLIAISQSDLTLRDDKPVVEFEQDGRQLMQVTFKPKLVIFCSDVREFEELGFRIPIELRNTALHAIRFMGYARKLQQIATFHNTIGDRMIPCVRPIMLSNALKLSNLVRSESVAWNDELSVERYVSTLQIAVDHLSRDNDILTEYHEKTKSIIMRLMNTDLLRQNDAWRDEMKSIRNIITAMETKGYTNLQPFKIHWDHQLYKVLEYQYLIGICDLSHRLPDIHIDIVFRQQEIQYRPTMEEIRFMYYTQLRRFIERPLTFKGLSDHSTTIFGAMVDMNRHRFLALYEKAETLFKQLADFQDAWRPFVILGCVNLEDLCGIYLKTRDDWDKNFKACKQFSQQIAKIAGTESRIDCFVINTSPIRSDIEFISRKYWEVLTYSLRSSILNDLNVLQDFLNTSTQVLQAVTIVDEQYIDESALKYERITNELPAMADILKSVQAKDSCLASWCRERVSALTGMVNQWEQLQPLIDNHSAALKLQIDAIKSQIELQMANFKDDIERFEIRWDATIADLEQNEDTNMDLFKDRLHSWLQIEEQRDKLEESCQKYNLVFLPEISEAFDKVTDGIANQGEQWKCFEQFLSEYENIGGEEWTVYRRRPYILTDFLSKWRTTASDGEQKIVTKRIKKMVDGLQSAVPTLQALQSDGLTEKHWSNIFHLMDKPYKPYHDITLKDVLSDVDSLLRNANEIQQLVRKASSEQIVRQALSELDQWGVQAELKTFMHSDSMGNGVTLIKEFNEIQNKVGDNQSLLQSAKNSASFETYADQAEIWETRLMTIDHILTSLSQIQRKWIYLEPIFGTANPFSEGSTFKQINKDFRYIMKEIATDPRVLTLIKIHGITNIIDSLDSQLNRCQSTLTAFMNTKRNAFPRFYFLSDDDLLELLGQSSKEHIIQKHIKKLVPGIGRLQLQQKNSVQSIVAVVSSDAEHINLLEPIAVNGAIETWLNHLLHQIRLTLIDLIAKCAQIDQFTLDVIKSFPQQVLCVAMAIQFTKQTEKAIGAMHLQQHLKAIKVDIARYANDVPANIDNLTKIKVRAVLLDLVHRANIVQQLIDGNVTVIQDWLWLQQLKYCVNASTKLVTVKMVYAEFDYSYEYLGNFNRLVDTKLTHKCYLTLTQAMQLGLGGNPFGPAGTGKTECVKSLGTMLGRLVLVFNCSENVDVKAITLILTGLVRCGAFGCFDEFNRLQEATLSVLSMIIQPIQNAIQQKSDSVIVFDEKIPLNLNCGIFVTLNPAGESYGGRQALPSNLQALFRPIVMQQPEPKEIARVILFVEGFEHAEAIGACMVELFAMAKKMLSPQRHYEWGLRELKTVLLACGQLLRQEATNGQQRAKNDEMRLAIDALRANTMSKLTSSDCQRFDMLIGYVFANVAIDNVQHDTMRESIELAFEQLQLRFSEQQLEKCLQLHEQLEKRMGVVVLGPSSCGKSSIIALLKQALVNAGKTIKQYVISPKAMSRNQLLGHLDADTRQWKDGTLTAAAIAVSEEQMDVQSWIICDGEIDPDWIEALNSVLDDNKLLTLPSGWRIQFTDNVNFIFETHDLIHASPATISRMGIVNLSVTDLPEHILYDAWSMKQPNPELFTIFMKKFLTNAMEWATSKSLNVWNNGSIQNILRYSDGIQSKNEFCVRLIYSFGFALTPEYQDDFAGKVFEWSDNYTRSGTKPKYCYFHKARDAIELHETDESIDTQNTDNIADSLIKTTKIKTYLDILSVYLGKGIPFNIIGSPGSGVRLLMKKAVSELTGYELITIKCSSQLTAAYVLYILKQNSLVISGVRGREYRPKFNKTVLFLKNIDLCSTDVYGTCEIMELVMQLIRRSGFYTETLEWISVSGLIICCSMLDIERHKFSPRFLAAVQHFYAEFPDDVELGLIMKSQFAPIIEHFPPAAKTNRTDRIVECLIEMYKTIRHNFTKTQHNHYVFTPKMLSNLIECLKYYSGNNLQQALFNEAKCIFGNRLTSEQHKDTFNGILHTVYGNLFDTDRSNYYFVPNGMEPSCMRYVSRTDWTDTVKRSIAICSTEYIALDSVITDTLLDTTASVCRILSRNESHILLAGPTGSCKIDAIYISCTFLGVKLLTITPLKNYNINDFYNDLKMAMQSAALDDQSVVLLVEHCWLTFLPAILNPIEAVMEGSEIPNLFGEDLESIAKPLKNMAQQDGYQDSLIAYFWMRVRQRLHIVLSLESESNHISELFESSPFLYNSTEIVWIATAPIRDPAYVAKELSTKCSMEAVRLPIADHWAILEIESIQWNTSPCRFKNLIFTYCSLYKTMLEALQKQQDILQAGVDKLSDAHEVVRNLKGEAEKQEVALAKKREMANNALEMITTTMKSATTQKSDLLELKNKTQENSKLIMERKEAVELELKEVEPILKEATAAVGQIKTEALSEIRSLRAPPDIIRDILEGVLRLMGTRDTSWNSMKSFLAKRGVKEDIRSLNPARISVESCDAVEKLLSTKADSFEVKNAKRASAAAAPLATWVIANVKYCKVVQSIKPLEDEQEQLQRNLRESENNMKLLKSGLDDVDARVKELSAQLNGYTQEAAILEVKLESARSTLTSSEILVTKLSTEYANWKVQLQDINKNIDQIDSNAFLIAFYVTHLSHMTFEQRQAFIRELDATKIFGDINILEKILCEQDRIIWESIGLTPDIQSMENAALLTKILTTPFGSTPIPLLNDPTKCATQWLSSYMALEQIPYEIITQHAERFTYTLELAIRFGKVLIVDDCNEIKSPLLSIISAVIQVRFNKKFVQVGNKLVDFNDNFKLILASTSATQLTTKPGIIDAFVTVIPFTTTNAGLTDQLMSKTIHVKEPELEKKRIQLLQNESDLLKKRDELQKRLLLELSRSQGDILKNEKLLETLNEVKKSSSHIDQSLHESTEIREKLLRDFEPFKSLCGRVANLYIRINQVYAMPVNVYMTLYVKSISMEKDFNQRKIFEHVAKLTYVMISRALPKEEHYALALHISKEAYPDLIPEREWELFITNFASPDDTTEHNIPAWINKSIASKIITLKSNHTELYQTLHLDNENLWRSFSRGHGNDEIPVPLSDFQKILIAQLFRPDLLMATMTESLLKLLSTNVPSEVKPNVQQLLAETNELEPILFITSGEIDPTKELRDYVRTKCDASKYVEMAIGKGQEENVMQQIRRAADNGQWICVKNVQLVPYWLSDLDELLQSLTFAKGFRIWLICDSTRSFPISLLNKCNKVLYEAPNSIKSKVQRLIHQWNGLLETKRDANHLKIYIALFIFNAVIQERRSFIPQGWSKPYEFSDADLQAAIDIIVWLEKSMTYRMDWPILKELCRLIAYGGRIDNAQDQLILKTNFDEFFSDKTMSQSWSPLDLKVAIPLSSNVRDYLNAVFRLPDTDNPEAFGLSASTVFVRDTILYRNVLKQLRHSELFMNTNLDKRVKPVLSLWRKLNENVNLTEANDLQATISTTDPSNPWTLFVISELLIARNLFNCIHQTLSTIHTAIKDMSTVSRDTLHLIRVICENQVPLKWRQIWSGPRLIVDYMKSVINRGIEAQTRFRTSSQSGFGQQIDFTRVFNVESFLAALKLTNARELGLSTCELELVSSLTGQANATDTTKTVVLSLMVDGAAWKDNKIVLNASGSRSTPPVIENIKINYAPRTNLNDENQKKLVELPLYSNSSRATYICSMRIIANASTDAVILSGAALIVADL